MLFKPPICTLVCCAAAIYCGIGLLGFIEGWIGSNHILMQCAGLFLIGTALGSLWHLYLRG